MQAQDIETYLADLGQELQNQGVRQPVCILMIGGAFMLTQIHNRPTTNDIDVLLKDIDDATTSPSTRPSERQHGSLLPETISQIPGSTMSSGIFSVTLALCRKEFCGAHMLCLKYTFHPVSIFWPSSC
ncbi:MAG: hypothetical protein JOZ71_06715 [Ktedonobacteraceae bacterium]|nr:hypothetical protein [Ktedonobacteraceae bacterium]